MLCTAVRRLLSKPNPLNARPLTETSNQRTAGPCENGALRRDINGEKSRNTNFAKAGFSAIGLLAIAGIGVSDKDSNKDCEEEKPPTKDDDATDTCPNSDEKSPTDQNTGDKAEDKDFMQKVSKHAVDPFIKPFQTLSVAEIEERGKKESESHQKQMDERKRRDIERLQKDKEKAEGRAALALEKERKQEAAKREKAEAAITKVQKNKDFEATATVRMAEISQLADTSMQAIKLAIEMCREHASKLKEAMDVSEDVVKAWPVSPEDTEVRIQLMTDAHKAHEAATADIIDYRKFLEAATKDNDTKYNKNIHLHETQINEVAAKVREMHRKLKIQETVMETMKMMQGMQDKDYASLLNETKAIVPKIKIGERGLDLSFEELHALLIHGNIRCRQLARQLEEQKLLEHERLQDALCAHKKANMREASEKLGQELDKQQEELQLEKERELIAQSLEYESELRLRLAKQKTEHHDLQQDLLALQKKDLEKQFDVALRERTIQEYYNYLDKIERINAQVVGLEAALSERSKLQGVITHVQDVNSCALGLMHAVAHDVNCEGENYQLIKIDQAVKRCHEVAKNNPFVEVVLNSIPPKAAERGIYSMSSLEVMFYNLLTECTKNPLNKLTRSTQYPKYKDIAEFENPTDMSEDELFAQAKYFMDKKCLPAVVLCMVQLDGEMRKRAQSWIDEARMVLEVRQAAELLTAYANSKAMGTIF